MSEVELHTLYLGLLGGARNEALRGELEVALPTGLVLREDGKVALDPDASVVSALRTVFAAFSKAGNVGATARSLREDRVQLPQRPQGGADKGQLPWFAPTRKRVRAILDNPRYAGAYVYGRTRVERKAGKATRRSLPPEEWQVLLPDAHPGYIDWPAYLRHLETLARNRKASGCGDGRAPQPREGSALLQSLAICGRRLRVAYGNRTRNGLHAYYLCKREFPGAGPLTCLSLPAAAVDRAVDRIERDFATLWDAPSTSHIDRKQLLVLLVEDATLDRSDYQATAHLRFRGGRGETVTASLPRPVHEVPRASQATLDRLLDTCTDAEAAKELNRQGLSNWNGAPFHARRVRDIRSQYRLRSLAQRLAEHGFLTASAMAQRLGVSVSTVRSRGRKGLLQRVRYSDGQRPKHLYAELVNQQPAVTETRCDAPETDEPASRGLRD